MSSAVDALSGRRVYIDANVFIFFLDGTPGLRDQARAVLNAAREGAFDAVTGDAAVAEVMVGPYRLGDPLVIRAAHDFFRQPRLVTVVGHTAEAFDAAAMLRGAHDMPFIDALHLATAAEAGCDAVITHDSRMRPALGVDVLPLG
ncbi:MAG: type II toxin-antitoxin system VapC family toxin [bacterium]